MNRYSPFETAAEMLGRKPYESSKLHPLLRALLLRLNGMCATCRGRFTSRQSIALAILIWQDSHPGEKAIED